MKGSFIIAGMMLIYLVLGLVASETGLTEPLISNALTVPDAPDVNASFLDKLAATLAPIAWAFNAVGGLFQLVTYQSDEVPPLVNTLIFAPMGFILLFTGIKLIRGSG